MTARADARRAAGRAEVAWTTTVDTPGATMRRAEADGASLEILRMFLRGAWQPWVVRVQTARWKCSANSRSEKVARKIAEDMARRLAGAR